jgi:hypothetical protein
MLAGTLTLGFSLKIETYTFTGRCSTSAFAKLGVTHQLFIGMRTIWGEKYTHTHTHISILLKKYQLLFYHSRRSINITGL